MRRDRIAIGAALAAGLALSGCWLQPGYDAGQTSWNPGETELSSATVEEITELWRAPVDPASSVNDPVTVGNRVYVSSPLGVVAALDASTGAPAWSVDLDATQMLSPVYAEGRLLLAQPYGTDFSVVPATGAATPDDGGTRSYSVAGGEIVERTVSACVLFCPSGQWSIDLVTWGDLPYRGEDSLLSRPGAQYAIAGGDLLWSVDTFATGYAADCDDLVEGPVTFCQRDWWSPLGGTSAGVAVIDPATAAYADSSGRVTVLDIATGTVRWTAETGAAISRPPAVVGDTLVVATDDGRLVALAAGGCGATTCTPSWEADLAATPVTRPVGGGDVVYVATDDGTVSAFAAEGCGAAACTPLATVSTGGSTVTGGPVVDGGRLIVGTGGGQVVAFGLPD